MIPNCQRHGWDESEDECRECGDAFCANCLVYVHGAHARPLCINCALKKSGIRGSKRTGPSRRERRARAKVEKLHDRARVAAERRRVEVGEAEAAASAVDLTDAGQRSWVSLDASRWDAGAI